MKKRLIRSIYYLMSPLSNVLVLGCVSSCITCSQLQTWRQLSKGTRINRSRMSWAALVPIFSPEKNLLSFQQVTIWTLCAHLINAVAQRPWLVQRLCVTDASSVVRSPSIKCVSEPICLFSCTRTTLAQERINTDLHTKWMLLDHWVFWLILYLGLK